MPSQSGSASVPTSRFSRICEESGEEPTVPTSRRTRSRRGSVNPQLLRRIRESKKVASEGGIKFAKIVLEVC